MYHLLFVCLWQKNSIFGEFSNIYLLSAQNRVKWRHKIQPIAKKFRPILIFFARDDAKLMPGEVCQVSCRYSNKWRSYSRKTEGGVGSDPPGGGGLSMWLWPNLTCPWSWTVGERGKMILWTYNLFTSNTYLPTEIRYILSSDIPIGGFIC